MSSTATQRLNGIDVHALSEVVEAVTKQPDAGRFRFRATHRWLDGTRAETSIDTFDVGGEEDASRTVPFRLSHDEPAVLLGTDTAVNPVEYALTALAGCMTTSFVVQAAARGITLHSVTVELEGDIDGRGMLGLDDAVRPGYSGVRVRYHVDADAPHENVAAALAEAQRLSPVHDIFARPTPVAVTLVDRE